MSESRTRPCSCFFQIGPGRDPDHVLHTLARAADAACKHVNTGLKGNKHSAIASTGGIDLAPRR